MTKIIRGLPAGAPYVPVPLCFDALMDTACGLCSTDIEIVMEKDQWVLHATHEATCPGAPADGGPETTAA